jgi:hypothetical protein
MPSCYPVPTPVSLHRYPWDSTYQIPWPRARLQTPLHKTLTLRYTQGHRYFSQTLPPPCPQLHTTNSPYKLLIHPVLTYAAPVWSNTLYTNYRQLQILQSKCLRVTGNHPKRTPIIHLHTALNLEPIHELFTA